MSLKLAWPPLHSDSILNCICSPRITALAGAPEASFFGQDNLAAGADHELHLAEYQALAPAPATSAVQFCNLIGDPPVFTNLVTMDGEAIVPVTENASIQVVSEPFIRGDCNGDTSIGLADGPAEGEWKNVLARADRALYCAKEQGRNRVVASALDQAA